MTNAFNLLDNMDGLAGEPRGRSPPRSSRSTPRTEPLATRARASSLALACAVAGFLPFNLRPGGHALAWMGDSGSQLIGFTLAALGLASS